MAVQRSLLLTLYLLSFFRLFCQSLEGEWEGWYSINGNIKDTAIMKLQFHLSKDGTYDVYSFTKFKSDKVVCKMSYKMLNEHSIYLEENELIRTNRDSVGYLFQKMTLEFDNSFKWMRGKWSAKEGKLKQTGRVAFTKKLEINDAQHQFAAMALRGLAAWEKNILAAVFFTNELSPSKITLS